MALSIAFGFSFLGDARTDTAGGSAPSESATSGVGSVPFPAALYIEPWDSQTAPSSEAGVRLSQLQAPASDPIHELGTTIEPTPIPTLAPTRVPTAVSAASVPYTPIPHSGGVEQWRDLVASIFPAWAVDAALSVIRCESGGNPNATGSHGERGLFQVHPLHFDSTYDPEGNARAAYRISGGGASWAAWSCRP